ncbi:UNVERIFIED_CONTAM: hypothetical protein K2H54_038207 [Gekko kuhli]
MQNREEERPSVLEVELFQHPFVTVTSNKLVSEETTAEVTVQVEIEKEESNISLQLPANRQASYLSNASSEEGKLTQNTCLLESASEKLEHASAADISIATQVDGTLTVEAQRVEIAEVFNVHLPNPKGGKTFSEVLIPCKTTEPLIPKKRAVLQNLKELPEATPTELRQLTEVKLLDKQGEDTLQELFIFLRDVTHRLVIDKRFRDFAKLADWYKVPEYETVTQQPMDLSVMVSKIDLIGVSGRFFVTTLPTIFHAKDGTFFRYRGSRMLEDLKDYILERKWEAVEPVPGWKSPSSIMMHGMAGLFYLSGWIRQIHSYLTGTLGIHEWGSYAIFILATLLIGLILGLILVLLGDCVFPSKAKAEGSESVDQSYDQIEEQQETPEDTEGEAVTEKSLSDEDNEEEREEESQDNSSGDSAVESSMMEEEDSEHHTSDQSSLRQRKNQEVADEL